MITRYIRDKKGKLKGCVVRTDEDNFGYSLCHHFDKMKNSKKLARKIAIDRANRTKIEITTVGSENRLCLTRDRKSRMVPRTVEPYLKKLMEDES